MEFSLHPRAIDRERLFGGLGVALVYLALGGVYLATRTQRIDDRGIEQALATFDVRTPPPPRPPDPPPQQTARAPEREGRASPPNFKSVATPVVAPDTPIPIPPPLTVAPIAREGDDPTAGAAQVAGPGYGAGGEGDGTGSGGAGDGSGGGGGGGTPLRLISGRIKNSDYPREAFAVRAQGSVGLRFSVGVNGRVTSCNVTRSSGSRLLDNTTCRLIMGRFRYRAATDRYGRPFPQTVTGEHIWELSERFVSHQEYDRNDDSGAPDGRD